MTRSEFLMAGIAGSAAAWARAHPEQSGSACDHVGWVEHCLRRMETIHRGMTRAQLLSVFKTEGGLSTRLHRTYVSQDCLYFKVDVDFNATGIADGSAEDSVQLGEGSHDVITAISKPYLQFTIAD